MQWKTKEKETAPKGKNKVKITWGPQKVWRPWGMTPCPPLGWPVWNHAMLVGQ